MRTDPGALGTHRWDSRASGIFDSISVWCGKYGFLNTCEIHVHKNSLGGSNSPKAGILKEGSVVTVHSLSPLSHFSQLGEKLRQEERDLRWSINWVVCRNMDEPRVCHTE